jgi:hypothetical protein
LSGGGGWGDGQAECGNHPLKPLYLSSVNDVVVPAGGNPVVGRVQPQSSSISDGITPMSCGVVNTFL